MLMTTELSGRHAVPVDEPADAEVPERARRRVFSAQYKLKILAEYESRSPVMRSALLRREGWYTSSISEWRRQREAGALRALGGSAADRRLSRVSVSWSGCVRRWLSYRPNSAVWSPRYPPPAAREGRPSTSPP